MITLDPSETNSDGTQLIFLFVFIIIGLTHYKNVIYNVVRLLLFL